MPSTSDKAWPRAPSPGSEEMSLTCWLTWQAVSRSTPVGEPHATAFWRPPCRPKNSSDTPSPGEDHPEFKPKFVSCEEQ